MMIFSITNLPQNNYHRLVCTAKYHHRCLPFRHLHQCFLYCHQGYPICKRSSSSTSLSNCFASAEIKSAISCNPVRNLNWASRNFSTSSLLKKSAWSLSIFSPSLHSTFVSASASHLTSLP